MYHLKMGRNFKSIIHRSLVLGTALSIGTAAMAQTTISNLKPKALLQHGIEQYQQGHYNLAAHTLSEFLAYPQQPGQSSVAVVTSLDREQAEYYRMLSGVKLRNLESIGEAKAYVSKQTNVAYRQRVAFELGKYYFENNRDLAAAITYYEMAGVDNLSNAEIADTKFELGYAYFINQQFSQARNLFVGIKEIPENKYYLPANYYYGLLTYNEGNFDDALKSFERVHNSEEYKDIVPYYETEIHYFKGDYDKVLSNSRRYLGKKDKLYYDKELRLLTAQTLFEMKRYDEALPYFEDYYANSERVKKEELYEMAYTYYQLNKYREAIDKFQQLSSTQDSLGQTSMYLLGDCYLKVNDKKGARNAFGLCSEMDYNIAQKEASLFLYNKLSYELGFDPMATTGFKRFLTEFPNSSNAAEARTLLSSMLLKNNNYAEAYDLLADSKENSNEALSLFQKAAVGRGLQLLQDKRYGEAEQYLDESLRRPVNPALEAVAYFWKGEIDYKQNQFNESVTATKSFLSKVKGNESAAAKVSSKATVQNANINLGYASMKASNYADAQTAFADAQRGGSEGSADAIVRQADAAFMQKDFDNAARLYDRAIAANSGDPDYARYQKALILGLQNKQAEKVELLKYVVQKGKTSIKEDATLELASEYIAMDKNAEAIALLEKLNTTNVNLQAKAAYQLAFAYQDNNQGAKAIDAYTTYITKYPAAEDRTAALSALKTLYVAQGKPEQYADFLQKQGITVDDKDDVENAYFDAADNDFSNGNYDKAIAQYDKYLTQYPKGMYQVKALYYRGESYYQQKKYDKALADYSSLLSGSWSEFSEDAALRAATINANQKNTAAAKQYYNMLVEHQATESLPAAQEGLMKIAFDEKDYTGTESYTSSILAASGVEERTRMTAQLYKAKVQQMNNQLNEAKTTYQQLDKANIGNISAEARYHIAEILFAQKQNAEAEKAASYAAQASNGDAYWTVKNYILLADILADNKDYFNAKATLQSIVKNAGDKTLVQEAKDKLEKVKQLEKNKSKLAD
ncbi:tetratricopeptide repeat protein [Edaphocola flava]|uniref:tetratricopeptide repeat protein n=1 Tax=Edaphocola flava TaxID=2499629 RepID=UPI00100B16E3|nr:tetratricopeptide repeat protein [Edaphocola flava]